jgi:starvation-inducible DNA-binding protein
MGKLKAYEGGKSAQRLHTPSDLDQKAVSAVAEQLNGLLADTIALYVKTKNFHWHVSGPHFRDYHLLFDEQSAEILASVDELAERVRKIGANTLRSVGQIAKLSRIKDNNEDYVDAEAMLLELMEDNKSVIHNMREAHEVADKHEDVATASLLENFIDAAEKRNWFLFEASRHTNRGGH